MSVRIFQPNHRCPATMHPHALLLGRIWRGWAVLVCVGGLLRAQEPVRERDLSLPIKIGSQEAYHPYSFVDSDLVLKGFAIDLFNAVAREMKLKVEWQALHNTELSEALMSERVDVIPFWGETKARRALVDFSVPILRWETVVVVRKDEKEIRSANDLKGRRVAVGQKGTIGELYLIERQPEAVRLYASANEEQLRLLAAGGCDAVVMSRLTAVIVIDRFKLKNLKILEGVPGYDVRYCLSVRKSDANLLARFKEGLSVIQRTGEYDDIYQKWFARFSDKAVTPLQIVSYVAVALALIAAGALWGILRQRTLLSRIAKQAAELSEQRSLLAALYDKHPLATVVLDIPAQGAATLVSLNQEAALLFALEPSAAVGHPLDELNLTKEMRVHLDEAVCRQRVSNQPARWETRLLVSQRVLEVTTMPLGTNKETTRLCVLSADITKRRLMDQEIAKSRRLRALGELVGGIAHEFNNLLTPIMATASMLRSAKPPVVVTPAELSIIDQSAQRAADLTKRLLAFGRKTDDPARVVRLSEAVTNCEALLKTMIDRRIEWVNDLPADLPAVTFNPTDFNQLVFNLVLNARDALMEKLAKNPDPTWRPQLRTTVAELPPGARPPRVGVSRDGLTGWQRFTVEDNGAGIPPEIVERIFEPFFTTKEVGKGTGLGLSTVWHQVTDAGGEIVVDSKPGEGTAFHVYLPRRESRPPMMRPEEPAQPVSPAAVAGCRILIVEDEPMIANTTSRILQRLGYVVATQGDGESAWQELSADGPRYDLLLIDLSMPRLSGIDLVKKVRTLPGTVSIVVMSGRVSDEDLQTLKTLKVDRILPKPFTTDQLKTVLSELLAGRRA